jgi:phage terminase large subunit
MSEIQQIKIPYTPRPLQKEFHARARRFSVAVCHRRFGKTVMAINWLLREILTCPHPRAQGAYIAPTYGAAKRIAWVMLRDYAGVIPGVKFNEAELRCDLPDGRRIWLLGAENPDSLRGLRLDAACLDEYADMNARLFPEIVRPALSDFGTGKCLWIGTPRGENQFKEIYDTALKEMEDGNPEWFAMRFPASETGVLEQTELDAARVTMDPSQYDQEFEVNWQAPLVGSYFAKVLDSADLDGRIGSIPWEPNLEVTTSWDLGIADSTAIWFVQVMPRENVIRVIDYFEDSGQGLHHYIKILKERPYTYGRHLFPHDVMVRELGSGNSRYEILMNLGVRPTVVPRLTVADGIEAVRASIPRCYFDRGNCSDGLKALRHYHRQFSDRTGDWKDRPNHDWSSHSCDSFRYLCVGLRDDDGDVLSVAARTGRLPGGGQVMTPPDNTFG